MCVEASNIVNVSGFYLGLAGLGVELLQIRFWIQRLGLWCLAQRSGALKCSKAFAAAWE